MAELFVANGICGGTVFFLPTGPTVLGRVADCQIQIGDPWISGLHARFERRNDRAWVVDLESRNGTFVNDTRVQQSVVLPGDRVRFGKTIAEYREARERPSDPSLNANVTIMRPVGRLAADRSQVAGGDVALAVARRQLALLNEIGKALTDAADVDACLGKILQTVSSAVRAERSALLLLTEKGVLSQRACVPTGAPPRMSAQAIESATRSRVGMVTSESLTAGERSNLCTPLWAENRILGMLVMERTGTDPFSVDDLELVTAVGYQATLAVERARFLEQVRSVEEQRKKLLRHFSPDVASMILNVEQLDRDPLEVSVRDEVTVLFSDVKGFTGLTERLPALELAALLQEYFRTMSDAIFEEKGTLDKFIGDGLMAVFGAPVSHSDDPVRAVRCAWNMLERLAQLNARVPADRRLEVRVGINTGRVIAGNFGSPDRLEFTVLGDTVNVASRLESMADPGKILVGKSTFERTSDAFEFAHLGARQVKGRRRTIEVYQLVAPRP